MSDPQPNNPLHGITLEQVVTRLEKRYGWEYLARNININCFKSNPSVKSSLKFLRRTPWARDKVEALYVAAFANSPLEVPVATAKAAPVTPSIVGADTVADVASNESSKVPSHSGSKAAILKHRLTQALSHLLANLLIRHPLNLPAHLALQRFLGPGLRGWPKSLPRIPKPSATVSDSHHPKN